MVEKYFEDKNLFNLYPIEKKEIYSDHDNAILFNLLMDGLNVPQGERSVPAVVMGEKVLVGDQPIIKNFI